METAPNRTAKLRGIVFIAEQSIGGGNRIRYRGTSYPEVMGGSAFWDATETFQTSRDP